MTNSILSDVHNQIMWNRLISVVEEQAVTLIRTAFSTSVQKFGDLSAGVFNRAGLMIAQAVTGTPGHDNAMAEAVGHFIKDIGRDNIHEGDVFITNDPWKGTGHLHDFTVVSPSFRAGQLIGFFACTAHVVDVGGRGFGPDANEVYEEGIFVPFMKFAKRGEVNQDLRSGLVLDHSQNRTIAARRMAEKKVCGHRSYRVATRLQSFNRPNMISMRLRRL